MDCAFFLSADVMHCFEIRTVNVDYFVGQDPLHILQEATSVTLPPPDSGIGAYLARSWETSIRQALMPVTANTSKTFIQLCVNWEVLILCLSFFSGMDNTCQSEEDVTDMNQIYQIYPDEVLGSGQFGIVYGGVHRRTARPVAIKVSAAAFYPK